jgi:acetyl-CoA carboxylase biotin carboxyl carrier protein
MNRERLQELIRIFRESGLAELQIKGLFRSVTLKQTPGAVPVGEAVAEAAEPAAAPVTKPSAPAAEDGELRYITAPLVGTFYSASSPDAEPYVKVGDRINADTIVCIVEAMKVMNEIEAEFDGVITEVLVENAQPVEYGQKLFAVRPA